MRDDFDKPMELTDVTPTPPVAEPQPVAEREWTRVSERLPEDSVPLLVKYQSNIDGRQSQCAATYDGERFYLEGDEPWDFESENATHWKYAR